MEHYVRALSGGHFEIVIDAPAAAIRAGAAVEAYLTKQRSSHGILTSAIA
jgi:hypothetical protein